MLFSCQTKINEIQGFSEQPNIPEVSTSQAEWFYTRNGLASFTLKSPLINRYAGEESYLEFPKGLEMNSYESSGKKDAHLKADYAIKYINRSIMEAKGCVILENALGESLETEYLIWDEEKEQIYTEEFVKITQTNQVIMGEGFISDIYFSNYTIKKSRGIIDFEE